MGTNYFRFSRIRHLWVLLIGIVALFSVVSIIGSAIWYFAEQQKPPPPPVEIVDLKIGGTQKKAEVKNGSYTPITFTLKHTMTVRATESP